MPTRMRSFRAPRLRPRQWVGAAIDVAGAIIAAGQLVGWMIR